LLDFHNHLIPGVDDGAASLEESLSGIERMRAQGIRQIITTPHFRASTLGQLTQFQSEMGRIDEAWRTLEAAVAEGFPDVTLKRGVELALDEPIDSVGDRRIRLGGSRFVLVEFPYFMIPPNSGQALVRLRQGGVTPIIAHPERYQNVEADLAILYDWKRSGAFLQLNAGSVVGAYGPRVERLAWKCLRAGLVDYLSSDYHSRGTCLIEGAKARLGERSGTSQFQTLAVFNGDRLLNGLDPTPVTPLPRRKSPWQRLVAAVRPRP
jgi:protein-tyrosine phosphatase